MDLVSSSITRYIYLYIPPFPLLYRVVIASRCTRKKVSTPTTSHTPQDPPLLYRIRFHSSQFDVQSYSHTPQVPPQFPQNFTSLSQDPPQNFPTRGTQLSLGYLAPIKAYLPPPPPRLHLTIHYSPSALSKTFLNSLAVLLHPFGHQHLLPVTHSVFPLLRQFATNQYLISITTQLNYSYPILLFLTNSTIPSQYYFPSHLLPPVDSSLEFYLHSFHALLTQDLKFYSITHSA